MSKATISDAVKYIGADDTDLDLFEGQYIIPNGISYNSYVILDDKIAVLDTVDARKTDEWLDNLEATLCGKTPDYLIINHMEPDHAANVNLLMDKYPTLTGVCNQKAADMMNRFFGTDYSGRLMIVKERDTLALGSHTLQFFMAPMVHWPEVMVTFEQSEGILFAADAFGKFGTLSAQEDWTCEARRYYFNICGKYGAPVQTLLKKAATLHINTICPLHGPILKENLGYYISLYNTWSSYKPENEGIFIAYCSMHGNTANAANRLAEIIRSKSDVKVSTADLARDDMAEALEDAFRYDRLVLACPTYDGDIMPVMHDFLQHLKAKNYQNRKVAFIENGSWAPVAGRKMKEAMQQMKDITLVDPVVTVESTVKADTISQLTSLAEALI
ncbi:MAG: FprA family A-type flavoprotein [Bacteroidales bacterium]|nr:FprA family A-type flavoprotein [Bacteroidales bacterium]